MRPKPLRTLHRTWTHCANYVIFFLRCVSGCIASFMEIKLCDVASKGGDTRTRDEMRADGRITAFPLFFTGSWHSNSAMPLWLTAAFFSRRSGLYSMRLSHAKPLSYGLMYNNAWNCRSRFTSSRVSAAQPCVPGIVRSGRLSYLSCWLPCSPQLPL